MGAESNLLTGLEIAVIGVSGRFPGAKDTKEFWKNLQNGIESISFFSDDELLESGLDKRLVLNTDYVKAKGMLEDIEYFDYSFFNYTPKQAELMDPQLRVLHECSWSALENAGYKAGEDDVSVGVYMGASPNIPWLNNLSIGSTSFAEKAEVESINNTGSYSTRISYKLNLNGPSYTVQSACSSSLVAIHLACQSLISGECDMALAGGVVIVLPKKSGYFYQKGMLTSPEGHCRPFDKDADGMVLGEGAGVVVLKRLEDAVADGDHIYAVVKGSAVNNDGGRRVGYTAPSIEGQAEVISAALEMAEVSPESISYVETHGTATRLGDPIEVEALKLAFNSDKKGFCGIGSVKSNIGHLLNAAGVAGFIKTVLSINNKLIPPSINFNTANSEINFENSPFYVNSTLKNWKSNEYPLRAGVSSFGIGGTNAHIILEEAPKDVDEKSDKKYKTILLSAKSESALDRASENLVEFLQENPQVNFDDVAYSLQVGRRSFKYRRMLVCSNAGDAIKYLNSMDDKKVYTNIVADKKIPIAFLFPGQGAQYINMGLELYENETIFKQELDRCFNILKQLTDFEYKNIIYPVDNIEEAEKKMKEIDVIQPLIFIFEYSLTRLLISWGINPDAMLGYSLGEYVAACISGVFSLDDAIRLVTLRGKLMKEVPSGAMLSVPLSEEKLKPLLSEKLSISIVNDESCIISGECKEIDDFEKQMKENRCMCMRLNNLHIAHSSAVEPILERFKDELEKVSFNKPQNPYISCITGQWASSDEVTKPMYWVNHLRNTVRFSDGIKTLLKESKYILVEVGSGRDLSIVARRYVGKTAPVLNLIRNVQKNISDEYLLLKQIGILWQNGVNVNWKQLHMGENRKRIPLPTYPFEKEYFSVDILNLTDCNMESRTTTNRNERRLDKVEILEESFHDKRRGSTNYVLPSNDIEEEVVDIVRNMLGIRNISIEDDFFELGGDSLKATILIAKIHEQFDVSMSVHEVFNNPTLKEISQYIGSTRKDTYRSIKKAEKIECYPMSAAQKRIYMLQQLDLQNTGYNTSTIFELEGNISKEKLENIFNKLVERHDVLRTSFELMNGQYMQKIRENVKVTIEYIEDVKDMEEAIKNFIKPFDLEEAPLLRVGMLKIENNKYILVFDIHHIISDGTTMGILTKEFSELYKGNSLKPLRLQYKDYTVWQNNLIKSEEFKKQEEYWINRFSDEIPLLSIPLDYPRPPIKSSEGNAIRFNLDRNITKDLNRIAKETGSTMYMIILSGINIMMSKYSNQEDIIIGSAIAGRNHAELQNIMGMFVNTLAIRNYPKGDKTYLEFLSEVKENSLRAYENQDYPFQELVEKLNLRRDMNRNPLFDVMFAMQNMELKELDLGDIKLKVRNQQERVSKFELSFTASELEEEVLLEVEYCSKLYRRETIERMIEHFKTILKTVSNNMKIKLSEIDIVSKDEKRKLLYEFNDTYVDYPRDKTIHELFEEQVEKVPDKLAVVFEDKKLTYRQLNQKSNKLARTLIEKGVESDSIVGIMADRSIEMIVGIMAILKAGGAYLPIDPSYPRDRIQYLLENSEMKVLLMQNNSSNFIEFHGEIISLENENSYAENEQNLKCKNTPKNLAYVMYTSGSTGRPKGVMVENRNVVRLVMNSNYIKFEKKDKILQTGTLSFDACTFEIWGALLNGLELYIGSKNLVLSWIEMKNYINANNITILWLTSPLFNLTSQENPSMFKNLRYLLVGGDKLSPNHINRVRQECENIKIVNGYGPTENTTFSTCFLIDKTYNTNIPIGKPISNSTVYILNKYNKLQPIGAYGEMCVGGEGVARGYFNMPQLTDEKFVENPFAIGEKMYKTGDLARWLPDGNIEFLGRIDNQVKIRGFRIEIGEIETELLSYEEVKDVVVIDKEDNNGIKCLCAYIVTEKGSQIEELKDRLLKNLPDYMIPSYFVQLEKIPLNANGKVDKKMLPEPVANITTGKEYKVPTSENEKKLAVIWSESLGVKKVGINDNFFELGGNSLKAIALMSKIRKELNREIPLKEFFKSPTIKDLSEFIENREENSYSRIEKVEHRECYEASSAQKRMYTLQKLDENSVAYNMPVVFELEGEIDKDKIEDTFKNLTKRHEALRTYFETVEDEIVQKIDDCYEFKLVERKDDEEIDNIIDKFTKPFDLEKASLVRAELVENKEKTYLLIDMHHIISDGVSMNILIKEFADIYNGETLEPLKIQYKDFAAWQNNFLKSEKMKKQEKYWLSIFKDEIPVLELTYDYERPAIKSFEGDNVIFEADEKTTAKLRKISKQTGTTMHMVLLSAFNIVLSKYNRQEDIIVGTPIAGRPHADLQNTMGMFVNTLALRNKPSGDKEYLDFLEEVKENSLKAYENQSYQFEALVEKLDITRDMSRNPLFDVMFNIVDTVNCNNIKLNGLLLKAYDKQNKISKFDLILNALEKEKTLELNIQFCTKIFNKDTIEKLSTHYINVLDSIANNPETKISEIELLTEKERNQILYEFNNTKGDYPENRTIQELFEEQVEKRPNNIALVFEDKEVTYRELNQKSNSLARMLRNKGVKADTIVGIMVEKSIEMIVGIMGVLKAGGAYLCMDPGYPKDRIKYMLEDSGTRILLTQEKFIRKIDFNGEMIDLTDEETYAYEDGNLENVNDSSDLAYVIYTSGSTGRPKGVMIENKALNNFIWSLVNIYSGDFGEDDKCLGLTNIAFDVSVCEIFISLTTGASLVINNKHTTFEIEEITSLIIDKEITFAYIPPSLLNEVYESLKMSNKKIKLNKLLVGVEPIGSDVLKKYLSLNKDMQIVNGYGPTETTICATFYKFIGDITGTKTVPIGKPLRNTKIYIVDKNENLQPIGGFGEIYISGAGIARGYLNNPELTLEKFIENPFALDEKVYKTGDLGRWLPDGNIEFLGRIDNQVKIRGFRIELGEIENRLLQHEDIKEAIVVVKESKNNDKHICAYVVCEKEIKELNLKNYLKEVLPRYMIPEYFIELERMPLTSNGKFDRKALPEPKFNATLNEYEPARNNTEEKLSRIWSEALEVERVGINDNFFELGGNSIRAISLALKINKIFNDKISVKEILKAPTIKEFSEYIIYRRDDISKFDENDAVLLNKGKEDTKNLFLIHDGSGEIAGYIDFCNNLNIDLNCWGIRADTLTKHSPENRSIENMAKSYIKIMKNIQPQGPYNIAGWSLGGTIAFEIVNQLEKINEDISSFIILDSRAPQVELDNGLPNKFELETEKEFVKQFLSDEEIKEKIDKESNIEDMWESIIEHFEDNRECFIKVKRSMPKYIANIIPLYDEASTSQIVYHLNMIRTLENAVRNYLPKNKIKTQVYLLKAEDSIDLNFNYWNLYCERTVEFIEVSGNHFTMFKSPNVIELVGKCEKIIKIQNK